MKLTKVIKSKKLRRFYGIYIYKMTNEKTGQHYIGQTNSTIPARISQHLLDASNGSGLYFHRMLIKHGIENFSIKELKSVDNDKLDYYEKIYIHKFSSFENGYNSSLGGRKVKLSMYEQVILAQKIQEEISELFMEECVEQLEYLYERLEYFIKRITPLKERRTSLPYYVLPDNEEAKEIDSLLENIIEEKYKKRKVRGELRSHYDEGYALEVYKEYFKKSRNKKKNQIIYELTFMIKRIRNLERWKEGSNYLIKHVIDSPFFSSRIDILEMKLGKELNLEDVRKLVLEYCYKKNSYMWYLKENEV